MDIVMWGPEGDIYPSPLRLLSVQGPMREDPGRVQGISSELSGFSYLSPCLTLANCLAASGSTLSIFSGVGSMLLISTIALAIPLIIT